MLAIRGEGPKNRDWAAAKNMMKDINKFIEDLKVGERQRERESARVRERESERDRERAPVRTRWGGDGRQP